MQMRTAANNATKLSKLAIFPDKPSNDANIGFTLLLKIQHNAIKTKMAKVMMRGRSISICSNSNLNDFSNFGRNTKYKAAIITGINKIIIGKPYPSHCEKLRCN